VRYRNARLIVGRGAVVHGGAVIHSSCIVIHNVRLVPIHCIDLRRVPGRGTRKFILLISLIEYTGERYSARWDSAAFH
jgi:hypothetical protein